ncbi:MAG: FAD-binding oxidoreductase, partial [Cyclobacteriaceae bacterium]|nr:FAD-binding oxidoreductase [Cyclobacteriaceae bacterium]
MDLFQQLNDTLGNHQILTGEAVSNRFSHVWEAERPLKAKAVLLPKNTEEVSHILRICHEHGQPIIIHGGLTNLVGATVAQEDQMVISLEKMNGILEVDTQSRTITLQAGVVLEHIQKEAQAHDLLFPLNFGAKGSAQIGGIISTNAGGLRVLRYGMTRDLVLGLQAVMADGTIIDSPNKMIKDNTGYDLKQLFIGSEGTLGVVTQAVLRLYEAPKSRCGALVALNTYQNVVEFLKYIDQGLAGLLSAFELMWNITYRAQTADIKAPIDYQYPYYVLLESLGSEQQDDQERL